MKFLRVTMPDGSQYDVPADIIASNRAAYYAERDTKTTCGAKYDKAFKEEYDYTLDNDDEIMDWSANNMNWSDVKSLAKKVEDSGKLSAEDFQEGWVNGEKEIV